MTQLPFDRLKTAPSVKHLHVPASKMSLAAQFLTAFCCSQSLEEIDVFVRFIFPSCILGNIINNI